MQKTDRTEARAFRQLPYPPSPPPLGRKIWANKSWLVSEVADAGEHHRGAGGIRGGDYFLIAYRAAGLDHCDGTGRDRRFEAVGKREEGVRGEDRTKSRRTR